MSFGKKLLRSVSGFFLVFSCLGAIVATVVFFQFWLFLSLPAKPFPEKKRFFIPQRTGAYGIARLLQSKGVIRDASEFYLLCLLKHSNDRLEAGEYAFSTLERPEEILSKIVGGKVVIYVVTLPEGSTLAEVAGIVARAHLAGFSEIIEAGRSARLAKALHIKAQDLEGYLFPDTYRFKKPVSGARIVGRMVARFWQELPADRQNREKELGMTLSQILTLASMIEKEAKVDPERAIIAGVFYNRLKIGMPLQSDPTAVYDLPGFSGPITSADLKRPSPYNTYRIKGLPPGPICNPGKKSILAAFYPAKVPYLYFVSNNDGTHHFSVTCREHEEAVSHYYELKDKAEKK
ncbi:MAG: endolytic transglycosylase MltG [Syntrophobacteraceae bacterium]|nr:endolytic transglycosylase MltG [Syntrophobacteraceae bacterium]